MRGFGLQPRFAQPLDDPQVLRVGEVVDDGIGDLAAHLVGFDQLFARGVHHGIQRAEVCRQVFGRGFPDESDAQGEQYPLKRNLDRAPDAPDDVLGRFFAQPGQTGELFGPQVVEVGGVVQQSVVVEQLDGLLAQSVDVHRLAADEVDDAAQYLRPAVALIGTVVLAFALVFHQRSAAFRTAGDVLEGTAVRRTGRKIDARDLGDDLAAFFDIYHIAYANVQQGDLFGVVQRGPLDGRSGQLHRIEVGDGGDGSGASHLEIDAFEPRERLFGLELESHGPSGRLGREAQLAPQGVTIDLDDHAVRSERQFPALFVPEGDVVVDLRLAAADPHLVRYVESPFAGFPHTLPMGRAGQVVASQLVERAVQPPLGDYGRGLLLERARCGIARIGQQRFAVLLAFAVEAVERGIGHQHFAPYFEEIGVVAPLQVQRNGANRADIGRYVIAPCAVAPRHGTEQSSVFVGERDGRAVEFELADELRLSELFLDASDEFVQLVERIGIAQRKHRKAMFDALEFGCEIAADAGRREFGSAYSGCAASSSCSSRIRTSNSRSDISGLFST